MLAMEGKGESEGEWWAGFWAVVWREEPNPVCKIGTPDKQRFALFIC